MDIEILQESALASAQSTIQNAIIDAGITRSELARGMGIHQPSVTRMLKGDHNLTVKTMAKALAVLGLEIHFSVTRLTS